MKDTEKRLFECEITIRVYVLAGDKQEAERIAADSANDAADDVDPWDVGSCEIKEIRRVDSEWLDREPYGSDDDLTVEQYFKELANVPPTREELEKRGQLSFIR